MLLGIVLIYSNPASQMVVPTLVPTLSLPPQETEAVADGNPESSPKPSLTPEPTMTSTPEATPTPSNTPTPSLTPTSFALSEPELITATPAFTNELPIPTAVPAVEVAPNAINLIVLGSDRRPDWSDWHTDAVHVISIQPEVPAVTVLSIPRDLYVYIPGYWMSRINFADLYGEAYGYEGGGPALLQQTLLYNLGIPVDHYARTDFDGFIGIIDALGGIDIPVHCWLEDHWPYPDENGEYPLKTLEPGVHHMDGETALWYARSRLTSSVFARDQRQQQILQAIWQQARRLAILPRVPELWEQFRAAVVTDLELSDVLMLAEMAFQLDGNNVRFYSIGYEALEPWTTPYGGSVFLPNWEEIEPLVQEALGPIPEGRAYRTLQTVEVWNGTSNGDWEQLAIDRLTRQGFAVVIGEPDRRDYANTQLIDFTTTDKGSSVTFLQTMLGIWGGNLMSSPDPGASVHYRLIIGADYQPCRSP